MTTNSRQVLPAGFTRPMTNWSRVRSFLDAARRSRVFGFRTNLGQIPGQPEPDQQELPRETRNQMVTEFFDAFLTLDSPLMEKDTWVKQENAVAPSVWVCRCRPCVKNHENGKEYMLQFNAVSTVNAEGEQMNAFIVVFLKKEDVLAAGQRWPEPMSDDE